MSATVRQSDVLNPHFRLPFQFGGINGGVLLNDQDSQDDIIHSILTICSYPIGSREDIPEFGIPDILFKEWTEDIARGVHASILRWENRVDTTVVEWQQVVDQFLRQLVVTVRGREQG